MSQPFSLFDLAADVLRDARGRTGLALAALGPLDVWLAMQLVHSVGAVLAQREALLVGLLAAIGCAITAGAGLMLTWLLIDDLLVDEGTGSS